MYILLIIVALFLYMKWKANPEAEQKPVENAFDELNEPKSSVKPSGATILEDYAKQGVNSAKKENKVDKLTELENNISESKTVLSDRQISKAENATKEVVVKVDKIYELEGSLDRGIDPKLQKK